MKRTARHRHTPIARKSRLAAQSPGRKVDQAIYTKLCREFKIAHKQCARCNSDDRPLDLHHTQGRGKNLLRTETFLALCRPCHRWVHDNPRLSREIGYLK